MTAVGFRASDLWCQTLAADVAGDPHPVERERLRASYLSLRESVAVLLNELPRSLPSFTVHDVSHVDALWETASLICGHDVMLNPAEGYVLGCAFAFHDAAMGLAAYTKDIEEVMGRPAWCDLVSALFVEATDRWPNEMELDDPPEDVHRLCVAEAVRKTHAERSASLVEQPWRLSSGNDLYLIGDTTLREAYGPLIGDLASSHWQSVDTLVGRFRHPKGSLPWQPPDWTIEPLKLACILRVADATQIDSRRAPSFLFSLRDPQGVSRDHWRFQEHMGRPRLVDDRISYSSMRPFERKDAESWWLALDYLKEVDSELKRVDALLHDLGKPRLAARAVAYVDRPERFAEIFPVDGWRPVDADVDISNIRGLIMALGGEQLYGHAPEVAVRELIQNAQDAVLAREAIDPTFDYGEVFVSLEQEGDDWILEVRDNGVGMDEEIVVGGLLDFGCSGWRTDITRSRFVGLTSGGFRPRGTFGVGFYSVFMLGDHVSVTTRRFNAGTDEARHLEFDGLSKRPILSALLPGVQVGPGTFVRVRLKTDPMAKGGLLFTTYDGEVSELVQQLAPSSAVPIRTTEWRGSQRHLMPPFDPAMASAAEVFERLYPRNHARRSISQHDELRDEFSSQATDLVNSDGNRLGLAMLGRDLMFYNGGMPGVVVVNGFLADRHPFFTGYFVGKPNRASRDNVELACSPEQFRTWIVSQEQRLRERKQFDVSVQLEFSCIMHRVIGELPDDYHIALTSDGPLRIGDIEAWASEREQVFVSYGWPIQLETRPPRVQHRAAGVTVTPPAGWLVLGMGFWFPALDSMFPRHRDAAYAGHRYDQGRTWQKEWWQMSGDIDGLAIERLCRAWECHVGDLLAPVAERNWEDYADLGIPGVAPVPVLHVCHP